MAGGSGMGAGSPSAANGSMPNFGSSAMNTAQAQNAMGIGAPSLQGNMTQQQLQQQQQQSQQQAQMLSGMSPEQRQQYAMQYQSKELAAEPWRAYGTQASQNYMQGGPQMGYGQPNGLMQRPPMMQPNMDMIRRAMFNPAAFQNSAYAAPRPPQMFQPAIRPNMAAPAAPQPQQTQANTMNNDWQGGSGWSAK